MSTWLEWSFIHCAAFWFFWAHSKIQLCLLCDRQSSSRSTRKLVCTYQDWPYDFVLLLEGPISWTREQSI
ncbi:hypothetical protein TcWFU_004806 [Taenia crassiceps]|uniref:Secreted protein n=1 Tax=Taenia crassiceps TaxID=6207 RepID=A0ABR4QR43_9CEST